MGPKRARRNKSLSSQLFLLLPPNVFTKRAYAGGWTALHGILFQSEFLLKYLSRVLRYEASGATTERRRLEGLVLLQSNACSPHRNAMQIKITGEAGGPPPTGTVSRQAGSLWPTTPPSLPPPFPPSLPRCDRPIGGYRVGGREEGIWQQIVSVPLGVDWGRSGFICHPLWRGKEQLFSHFWPRFGRGTKVAMPIFCFSLFSPQFNIPP